MLNNRFVCILLHVILTSLYIKLSCKLLHKFITTTKCNPILSSYQRNNLFCMFLNIETLWFVVYMTQ